MSTTPRTDAFDKAQGIFYKYGNAIGFARTLERELTATTELADELAKALKTALPSIEGRAAALSAPGWASEPERIASIMRTALDRFTAALLSQRAKEGGK